MLSPCELVGGAGVVLEGARGAGDVAERLAAAACRRRGSRPPPAGRRCRGSGRGRGAGCGRARPACMRRHGPASAPRGRVHGGVDVVGVAGGEAGEGRAGARIEALHRARPRRAASQRAVDEVPVRQTARACRSPALRATRRSRSALSCSGDLAHLVARPRQPCGVDLDAPAGRVGHRHLAVDDAVGDVDGTGRPATDSSRGPRWRTRGSARRSGSRRSRCMVNSVTIDRLAACGVTGRPAAVGHARHPQRPRHAAEVADVGLHDVDGPHVDHVAPAGRSQSCSPPVTSSASASRHLRSARVSQ